MADAAALPLENENVNRDVSSKFNFKLSLIEAGGKKDLVEDWMKVRKDKKASNTKTALRSFLNEIAQNQLDLNQVLEICISNSWKGFKANWIKDEKPNGLDILREINKANGI